MHRLLRIGCAGLCGAWMFPLAAGPNLWPDDGSFETGHALFHEQAVAGDAKEGRYALLMPAEATSLTGGYAVNVLKKGPTYVFSFWVKTPVDTAVHASLYTERYVPAGVQEVAVKGGEWQKIVFHIDATPGNSIRLALGKSAGVPLLLDAIKLSLRDAGPDAADYTPPSPVSAGVLRINGDGEVLESSPEPLTRLFRCCNNSQERKALRGVVTLEAPELPPRELWSGSLELAPGEVFEKPLEVLSTTRPGYWVVRTALTMEDGSTFEKSMPFAVVEPHRVSDDPFMGLHVWRTPLERYRRIGVKSARNIIRWAPATMRDGHYVSKAVENGFQQQLTMDVRRAHASVKRSADGVGTPEELEHYLADYFRDAPATVRWVDMENEPDLGWRIGKSVEENAKHYAAYYRHFAAAVRKALPHAAVGAAGTAGDDFNSHFPFLRTVAQEVGGEVDVFPIHPYCHARYIDGSCTDIGPEMNGVWAKTMEARSIVKRYAPKAALSFGEVGWALDVRTGFLDDAAIRHGQYVARLFLMARALDVLSTEYFLGDEHFERSWYYYGLWRNSLPLVAAAAYAATAQRLDGAKLVSVLENDAVYLYVFRDADGRLFAAGWTTDVMPVGIELPLKPGSVELRDWLGREFSGDGAKFELTRSPRYWIARKGGDAEFLQALRGRVIDRMPLAIRRRPLSRSRVAFDFSHSGARPFDGRVLFNGRSEKLTLDAPAASGWKVKPATKTLEFDVRDAGGAMTLYVFDGNGRRFQQKFRTDPLLPLRGALPELASRDYILPNDPDIGYNGPDDLSVRAEVGWNADALIFDADVTDDVHEAAERLLWERDSLQLAIDTRCDGDDFGFDDNDFEFAFAHRDGKTLAECGHCPPGSSAEQLLGAVRAESSRTGNVTHYHVEIPWSALKVDPVKGRVISLNFIVNDSDADGRGRGYWMGLTPGIGEGKTPGAYRKFVLE